MAAYYKVDVVLNSQAVQVGLPSPQSVSVTLPLVGPAGPVGSVGPAGPQGPQGVPGTGLEVLTTQGDLLYQGASTGQRLPIGAPSQILKVSAGGIPEWGNESGAVTSVNGKTGTVILDGRDIDTSGNDDSAAFFTYEFADGNGIYYPIPDSTLNSKRVYRTTTGHYVFFQSLRWHITDGSPNTQNIIESSDDDNAAWPWLSAWDGSIEKAKLSTIVGRARSTFLFVGDSVPSTSVSGLGTAATSDSTAFAAASHTHTGSQVNVGTTANLPLKTGTNGVVEAGSFGTAAGSFCEGNDARLSDARTPSSTLAHKASHATGGTDALAPSDIGAQSLFTSEGIVLSANVTLASSRAKKWRIQNYNGTTYSITLPTTGVQEGDVVIITTGTLVGSQTIREDIGGGNFVALATISADQSYRFISEGTASDSWVIDPVYTHTHVVADVTGAAASGSITTSGLTQATARILGRTTVSTGAIEEIQIGSGLSLSAGELSATGGDTVSIEASAADILSVASGAISADDAGADRIVFWDDSASKLAYLEAGSGLSLSGTTLTATATGTIGGSTGSTDNSILRSDGTGGSTLQDSAFVIADNATASPNNTVNHASIQATGGTTNVSVSIVPKGVGAFMLQVPNAAAGGGNARGDSAVDLQSSRSAATQVASATRSVICGGGNNTASAQEACVLGGTGNNASGFQAAILGGRSNTASGDRAIAAGDANTSNGVTSFAVGVSNTSSSTASCAIGSSSRADRLSLFSHASGAFVSAGDSQRIRAVLRCKTTTNAAVEMALDGSTTYLTIPSGKVIFCNIKVVGVKSDGAVVATYERQYAAKNVAGTSSEVFAPVTIGTDNASSTSLEVATVDAGDYIRIRPTGITSETWRWVASVDAVEVAYGT
jgi:hypothetical protein